MRTYVTPTVYMLLFTLDNILTTMNSAESPVAGTFADKWEDLGGMF